MLWCVYAGSSLEVKIETDGNDAMEIKTEADSNDMFECPRYDDKPSSGMFRVCICLLCLMLYSLHSFVSV